MITIQDSLIADISLDKTTWPHLWINKRVYYPYTRRLNASMITIQDSLTADIIPIQDDLTQTSLVSLSLYKRIHADIIPVQDDLTQTSLVSFLVL